MTNSDSRLVMMLALVPLPLLVWIFFVAGSDIPSGWKWIMAALGDAVVVLLSWLITVLMFPAKKP